MNEKKKIRGEGGGPSDAELRSVVPRGAAAREFRVGIFVLLGIVSALTVLYVTTDPGTFRGRYTVTTTVADAGGVRNGDPVQMRGVNIGRVHGFDLSGDQVRIVLELEGEFEIPGDSRTRLLGLDLLGGRVVEVVPGDSPEPLPPGGELPGSSAGDIMATANEVGQEARAALQRVRTLLREPTVSALRGSATDLSSLLGELRSITQEQRREIARLTESLNRSAEGLEAAAASGPDAARAVARADSALARLVTTGESLEQASASLESVLGRLNRGEGTLGQLARNDSLYVNLNRAAESLFLLATDIRENPGRYVRVEIF